jgi:hypothetical protein
MNYRLTTILLAVALLLILGVSSIQAAPEPTVQAAAPAGDYDFTQYGTAWIPEIRAQYGWIAPRGWGLQAKAKTTGYKWMHIPIPYPTVIASSAMKIKYVEFCLQSNNGASTYPVHVDYYADTGSVWYHQNISWPADNNEHCIGYTPAVPVWQQSLGISLQLYFPNTTDMITLYKAWVRVTP